MDHDDKYAAGGGALHENPADLSSPVIQKALKKIYDSPNKPPSFSSLAEFTAYLSDPKNSAIRTLNPAAKDWSHPLSEYFISSSHNTYLVGHQLYGDSTTEGYVNTLTRGCRCIEIDVWDGDDGEPEVFHGYTLTKEIKFKDVCKAINEHAFSKREGERFEGAGEGPVIISLECHASHQQQIKMVEIMQKCWGEKLVQGIEPEDVQKLPSPVELRRKIVVKAKYVAPDAAEIAATTAAMAATTITEPVEKSQAAAAPNKLRKRSDLPSSSDSSSDEELAFLASKSGKKKPKKSKVIRAFARLGAYCSSHHFPANHPQPFTHAETSLKVNHVYSFSEKVFKKHRETHDAGMFEHNKSFLMRVYPFGLRFGSSNGDPAEFWARGVQIVALNWQKCDKAMMLNEGMFAGEGGYVLKPPGYRAGDKGPLVFQKMDLTVEVIAGSKLPLPKGEGVDGFKPFVKIDVHTVDHGMDDDDDDDSEGKLKQKTGRTKGRDCVWGDTLKFRNVEDIIETLSFVRFRVFDHDTFSKSDLAAWACIRLDRLQTGYRVVRLYNDQGMHTDGVLLVKIDKDIHS